MGGSTKSISSTPNDIQGLRSSMVNWLMQPQQGGNTLPYGGPPQQQMGNPAGGQYQQGPRPQGPQTYMSSPSQVNGSAQGGMSAQSMPGNGMQNNPFMGSPGRPNVYAQDATNPFAAGNASQGLEQMAYLRNAAAAGNPQQNFGGPPPVMQQMATGNSGSLQNNTPSYTVDPRYMASANPFGTGAPGAPGTTVPTQGGPQNPNAGGVDWTKNGTVPTQGPPNPAFNQINNQAQIGGPWQSQGAPGTPDPNQINPFMIQNGSYGQMSGPTPFDLGMIQQQQIGPGVGDPREAYQQVGAQGNGLIPQDQFGRGQVRDATAQSSGYNPTQSVDQLGGANSAFFRNMQAQLQPAFEQGRAESLAAAKEGLGNMGAGTAVANALGTAMNRSLGNEQATLANYATQGLQTEVGRQLQDAGQTAQVGIANANRDLAAQQGNQSADQQFLNSLLGQGNLGLGLSQLGLQGQIANQGTSAQLGTVAANNQLQGALANQQNSFNTQQANIGNQMNLWNAQNQFGQNAQQGNMGANLQAALANQGAGNNAQAQNILNSMNQQQFNANLGQNNNQFNANLGAQYQQLVAQMGQQNAQNFLAMLMGMGTTGVQGNQVVQSGGAGALLGPLAGGLGSYFGAKAGK